MRNRLSFALLLVCPLAGCGEVIATQEPDAEVIVPDAEIVPDALIPDADLTATATATAHAHFGGTGATDTVIEGVTFVSLRPDGSIADTGTSDVSGNVTLDIWPGGSVTAIYPHTAVGDTGHELVTYFGVQPGDALSFGSNQPSTATGALLGTLTASWPTTANLYYGEAYNGTAFAGFYAPTVSGSMSFYDQIPSPVDIFYRAYNSSFTLLKWGYRSDVTVPGGSAALGFWNDYTSCPLATSGLQPEVTSVNMNLAMICNVSQSCDSQAVSGAPTGGAYTGNILRAVTGDRTLGTMSISRGGGFQSQRYLEAMASSATQWTVTSPPPMPWTTSVLANARARSATFFLSGPGTYDGIAMRFSWSHYDPITMTNYNSNWHVLMPPRAAGHHTVQLPELGEDLEDVLPSPIDSMGASIMLIDIEDSVVADYDELRQLPERQIMQPDLQVRLGAFTKAHTSGSSGL